MKQIPLTRGYFALVSDKDYRAVSKYKWHISLSKTCKGYAVTKIIKETGKISKMSMHRFILEVTDPKIEVDHINGNGLDNRRCNLRLCTTSQNQANKSKATHKQYKGVCYQPQLNATKPYRSMIMLNGKSTFLGYFYTAKEAAIAYNKAAKGIYGKFAKLNEI